MRLLEHLQDLETEFPAVISNARGVGLFCAFDISSPDLRTELRNHCFGKGLIILPSGERSVRFRPPLNVSKREIDLGISIIRDVLKKLRT